MAYARCGHRHARRYGIHGFARAAVFVVRFLGAITWSPTQNQLARRSGAAELGMAHGGITAAHSRRQRQRVSFASSGARLSGIRHSAGTPPAATASSGRKHRAPDRNDDGRGSPSSRDHIFEPDRKGHLRLGRARGSDPARAGALASSADCRRLPFVTAFGARQKSAGRVARGNSEKEAAGPVSSERRRVFSGFPASRSTKDSERWHSLPPDSVLAQHLEPLGRTSKKAVMGQVRST